MVLRLESKQGRQRGRQAEERLEGWNTEEGTLWGTLFPEDVLDCLVVLGQCTGLEEPGEQEVGRFRKRST